jgi:hypothetical protein
LIGVGLFLHVSACGGGEGGDDLGGGPMGPSGPGSGAACRIVPGALTTVSIFQGGSSTDTVNCTFNATTNAYSCSHVYSDTLGFMSTTTTVVGYNSRADLVDEVRVIPPLSLSLEAVTTGTGTQGPINSTDTNGNFVSMVCPAATTTTSTILSTLSICR